MSVATPTVLPRSLLFPNLLPKPPQPHPTPLPKIGQRYGRLNSRRDLLREMEDLSDEEDELDELNLDIKNRGFNFLIPIGRTFTQHEEKNDADEASDESDSDHTGEAPSMMDEGENDSAEDLDVDMEDMDDEGGDITAETADPEVDEFGGLSSDDEEDGEPPSDL
ncbi:hypothetical protein AcW1_006050 [Taiwanofungus camphoratus]|nr:hypothetical protein AcW1_006050 [Antrodia cinnamomea]